MTAGAAWTAMADDRVARLRGLFLQVSRYATASVVALGTDTAIYLAAAIAGFAPVVAAVIGYAAGMAVHYLLSIGWVFAGMDTRKSQARLILEFAASGLLGLALTAVTIAAATGFLGIGLLPAKVAAVVVSFAVIFAVRRALVFAAA